ncbi:MAG: DUF4836 family protein, partial [Bacteroidia bacterium]|nr:DUF4836 family protein [Bacteroidia bacterium]
IKNSGMDFGGQFYLYVTTGSGFGATTGAIIPLTDADAFTNTLRDLSAKEGLPFTMNTTNGMRHAVLGDGYGLIVWTDDRALLLQKTSLFGDSEDLLEEALATFEHGCEDKLIDASHEFQDLLKQQHDAAMFLDYEKIAPLAGLLNPMVAQAGLKDAQMAMGLDFKDGETNLDMTLFYGKDGSRYADVMDSDFDQDIMNGICSPLPIAFMSVAMEMDNLYDLLDETGLAKEMEQELKSEGIELQDLMEALSGDAGVVLNRLELNTKNSYSYSKEPSPSFVGSLGIEDREEVEKALDAIVSHQGLSKRGNVYTIDKSEIVLILEEDRLLVSNMTHAEALLAEEGMSDLPANLAKLARNYPTVMAIDMEHISEDLKEHLSKELPRNKREEALREFPILKMETYAEKPNDRMIKSNMRIVTVNPDENSLRTIINYLDLLSNQQAKKKERESVTVTPL